MQSSQSPLNRGMAIVYRAETYFGELSRFRPPSEISATPLLVEISENRDFLNVDSLLSDEELAIRDATRDFVDDKILPVIEQHHRDGVRGSVVTASHAVAPPASCPFLSRA